MIASEITILRGHLQWIPAFAGMTALNYSSQLNASPVEITTLNRVVKEVTESVVLIFKVY